MLELYHYPPSTCSQKVRLVLAEKGMNFVGHIVDLPSGGQHAPEYVKLNPGHVVPTLVHNGSVLIESTLICEYLEDAFPDIPLLPATQAGRHAARLWTQFIDRLHAHVGALTFALGPRKMIAAQGPKAIEANIAQIVEEKARAARRNVLELGIGSPIFLEALQAFVSALDRIDATLGERNWLAGDSLSLADAAALPYVLRLDDLSMSQLITARPRLAAWYKRMQERPSYATAITSQTSPMVQVLRAASADDWPTIEILAAKMALPQN